MNARKEQSDIMTKMKKEIRKYKILDYISQIILIVA